MPELGPDIGATLRETRMRNRIDIGEVELRTKIRAKYLRAIENEEWDLLPGPIYVKSFLRTYGDYLGLDSRLLVDEYKRRYELAPDAAHRPLSAVKRDRERERERAVRGPRGPLVPSWAIIALVLVGAGVALYFIGRGGGSSAPKVARGVTRTHLATHHTAPRKVHHLAPTHTTAIAATSKATLKLVATAADWICVENGSGKALVDGVTFSAGQTIPTTTAGELFVGLGNNNITITANGKPYTPTAASAIGLKVTPRGVTTLPHVPSCGQ